MLGERQLGHEHWSLGRRIAIIGGPGSGKTWLANHLSGIMGIPAIELDTVYWGPGWTPRPREMALKEIAHLAATATWIMDGTYRRWWPVVWPNAHTLIWLDYGRSVLEWRLLCRTLPRVIGHQELWHGNVETWRGAIVDTDNLFRQAWNARSRLRARVLPALTESTYRHLGLIRHTSPRQTQKWLARIDAYCAQS